MSNQNKDRSFFIGWEATPAASISAFTKKVTILFVVVGLAIAGVATALQQTVTSGTFNYGNVQEFSGVLVKNPVPMLITDSVDTSGACGSVIKDTWLPYDVPPPLVA